MKTLVVYYSRTGNTKRIAEQIAKEINADVDEIIDLTNRKGFLSYLKSCFHAIKKKITKIKYEKKPNGYDLVVIGTPVWVGVIAPAVRTYLTENKIKKAAIFCVSGQGTFQKSLDDLKKYIPEILASLSMKQNETNEEKIKEFIKKLR